MRGENKRTVSPEANRPIAPTDRSSTSLARLVRHRSAHDLIPFDRTAIAASDCNTVAGSTWFNNSPGGPV